ncbi:hypothetical protein GCM10020369_61280 [Cryptosporangium minutisporangium]|uniref:Uncharacterized protein n=1 Tax=Cryptosporangium minutisporangium TaxID=113569 RepID=A0ABP6T741_9ACTN
MRLTSRRDISESTFAETRVDSVAETRVDSVAETRVDSVAETRVDSVDAARPTPGLPRTSQKHPKMPLGTDAGAPLVTTALRSPALGSNASDRPGTGRPALATPAEPDPAQSKGLLISTRMTMVRARSVARKGSTRRSLSWKVNHRTTHRPTVQRFRTPTTRQWARNWLGHAGHLRRTMQCGGMDTDDR